MYLLQESETQTAGATKCRVHHSISTQVGKSKTEVLSKASNAELVAGTRWAFHLQAEVNFSVLFGFGRPVSLTDHLYMDFTLTNIADTRCSVPMAIAPSVQSRSGFLKPFGLLERQAKWLATHGAEPGRIQHQDCGICCQCRPRLVRQRRTTYFKQIKIP